MGGGGTEDANRRVKNGPEGNAHARGNKSGYQTVTKSAAPRALPPAHPPGLISKCGVQHRTAHFSTAFISTSSRLLMQHAQLTQLLLLLHPSSALTEMHSVSIYCFPRAAYSLYSVGLLHSTGSRSSAAIRSRTPSVLAAGAGAPAAAARRCLPRSTAIAAGGAGDLPGSRARSAPPWVGRGRRPG